MLDFLPQGTPAARDRAEGVKSSADEFWPGQFRFAAEGLTAVDQPCLRISALPGPAEVLTTVAMTEILSTDLRLY
ncbi:MAG: hypothetical protein ACYCY0_10740 [Acidithiobacillus ferrivorans]